MLINGEQAIAAIAIPVTNNVRDFAHAGSGAERLGSLTADRTPDDEGPLCARRRLSHDFLFGLIFYRR